MDPIPRPLWIHACYSRRQFYFLNRFKQLTEAVTVSEVPFVVNKSSSEKLEVEFFNSII